jgi:hypothetical protein
MRLIAISGALLLITATASAGSKAERRAWEWTVEERIALRTDPAAAKARVDESRRRLNAAAHAAKQANVVDTISGGVHPELFLPHEVFDELMQFAFLSKTRVSDSFRKDMMPIVAEYGLPSDFWDRLRNLSSVYLSDAFRVHDLSLQKPAKAESREREEFDREVNRTYGLLCRSRIEALARARQEFGAERFDRFLYGAVARNMFRTSFGPENPDVLRQLERGCR